MEASSIPGFVYRSRLAVPAARLRLCSDDQLIERFRDGRDEAFRVIHDRYRARLLAYVRQMLVGRSSEDVEDVLQDVFERAARTLRFERAPIGLRPWLYSVAHNRCIDELRRRPPAPPDVLAAQRLPVADTSAVAERRADVDRLFRDLRALPELQRSALLMRELQGLSHDELAGALDATVPAVKSLLVRARVGLIDAEAARDVSCATIRNDLADAHDRRVKAGAQAVRHLRECGACRTYRADLRRTSRQLAALAPGPGLFPLALLGRLLGGSVIHAEAPVLAGGIAGSGGVAIAGVGKLAALLSAATVVTTGVVLEHNGSLGRSAAGGPAADLRHAARPGPVHLDARRVRATSPGVGRTGSTNDSRLVLAGGPPISLAPAGTPSASVSPVAAPAPPATVSPPAGTPAAPAPGGPDPDGAPNAPAASGPQPTSVQVPVAIGDAVRAAAGTQGPPGVELGTTAASPATAPAGDGAQAAAGSPTAAPGPADPAPAAPPAVPPPAGGKALPGSPSGSTPLLPGASKLAAAASRLSRLLP